MTDHDDAARELVRRAFAADPVEDEFDVHAGLLRVQARTNQPVSAPLMTMSPIEIGTLTVVSTHGGYRVGPREGEPSGSVEASSTWMSRSEWMTRWSAGCRARWFAGMGVGGFITEGGHRFI